MALEDATIPGAQATGQILLYTDDPAVRDAVVGAVGSRAVTHVATAQLAVIEAGQASYDLIVADAETAKLGGIGLARQLVSELASPPPIIVLVVREQDGWLASWSGAARTVLLPIDPFAFAATVDEVLNARP